MANLLGNFASLITGSLIVRVLAFSATVVVTRALGPGDFGTLAFGLAVALVFALSMGLGVDDLLVREIARRPQTADALVGHALLLRLPAVPLALGIGLLGGGPLYLWLAAYGVLHSYVLLVCAALRGRGRNSRHALLLSLQMALIAASSISAAWLSGSVVLVAEGYALATLVALGIGYGLLRAEGIQPRFHLQPTVWADLLRTSWPFGMTLLGLLLLDRLAIIVVAGVDDQLVTGLFGAVYNLVLAITNVPMMAAAALFPLLARLAQHNRAELDRLVPTLLRYSALAGVAVAAALMVLASTLVPLLFGPSYEASVPILRVLASSLPGWFLTFVLITILEATDQQRSCATGMVQALLVAAPVCLLATRLWGVEGASGAYVFAHLTLTLSLLRRVSRVVSWRAIAAYG